MLKALMLVLALAFVSPAFAQVIPPESFSDQAWGWFATVAIAAVPIITGFGAKLLWSQSRLAGIILSQKMLDKLNAGIIAFIRAEVERRRQALSPAAAKAEASASAPTLTTAAKKEIVAAAQPKIEAAFKETLVHFDKKGSQVTEMILGRVDQALRPDPIVPHALSK